MCGNLSFWAIHACCTLVPATPYSIGQLNHAFQVKHYLQRFAIPSLGCALKPIACYGQCAKFERPFERETVFISRLHKCFAITVEQAMHLVHTNLHSFVRSFVHSSIHSLTVYFSPIFSKLKWGYTSPFPIHAFCNRLARRVLLSANPIVLSMLAAATFKPCVNVPMYALTLLCCLLSCQSALLTNAHRPRLPSAWGTATAQKGPRAAFVYLVHSSRIDQLRRSLSLLEGNFFQQHQYLPVMLFHEAWTQQEFAAAKLGVPKNLTEVDWIVVDDFDRKPAHYQWQSHSIQEYWQAFCVLTAACDFFLILLSPGRATPSLI